MTAIDPAYRVPVSYIDKSREYYAAQGFDRPYRWAYNEATPFHRLDKPLSECTVGLVTTASRPSADDSPMSEPLLKSGKESYAVSIEPAPESMYTDDLSWDREATHTRDVESFLPIRALSQCATDGRIKAESKRFYGVPTEYSQRKTRETDAPRLLEFCREDDVDVAILVPL